MSERRFGDTGQDLIEYTLMLALVVVAAGCVFWAFGGLRRAPAAGSSAETRTLTTPTATSAHANPPAPTGSQTTPAVVVVNGGSGGPSPMVIALFASLIA